MKIHDTPTGTPTDPRGAGRSRRGFTLTELMVAMALSLGIMLIISESFKTGLDVVRITHSNSVLINHLSDAGNRLEHDLFADHFLPEGTKPNGGVRLSDQWMHQAGWTPPQAGFFRIESYQPQYEMDAFGQPLRDLEGNTLSTAVNHRLHFTSILRGGNDAELFVATTPMAGGTGPVYKSRAAEIAWFLVPNGRVTSDGPRALPLYDLKRRYRLVALDDSTRPTLQRAVDPTNDPSHPEVISVPPAGGPVNTLATIRTPANRLQLPTGTAQAPPNMPSPTVFQPGTPREGEDTVLTDVLSFQVLVWWDGPVGNTTPTASGPRPHGAGTPPNTEAPYDWLYATGGVFDTGAANIRQGIRVRALKVIIRLADTQVGIARSNTWEFDM